MTAAEAPAKPRTRTWLDYQEPGTPEPSPLLTRSEFVERLRAEGVDVTPRTLAYWESEGVIPRAVRRWRDGAPQSVYPEWMLAVVRTVRGMQAQDATLDQIRHAIRTTPWLTPMSPPGEPSASVADASERFNAYVRAAEALGPQLARFARLRELAFGVRIVDFEVRFRDASGVTGTHRFGAPFAWLGEDDPTAEE